jgi:germination protein M
MASEGAPGRGEFEAELVFNPEQAGKGQLEVFEVSMKDGSEIHKIIIPVEWK